MALSNLTKVQTVGIGSNIEVVGVITTGQFKSGTSNLHSTGVELTNLNVSGIATIAGNLSIGGTLTYQDVTNIDSVGLITAREGIFIPDDKSIRIGNTFASPDLSISSSSSSEQVVIDYARSGTGKHLRFRCTDLMFENYNGLTRIARFQGGVGAVSYTHLTLPTIPGV